MIRKIPNAFEGFRLIVAAASILFVLFGCATDKKEFNAKETSSQPTSSVKVITAVDALEDDAGAHIKVSARQKLAYTSVKQPSPPSVILYFPNTRTENVPESLRVDNRVIAAVNISRISGQNPTTRIEVSLKKDAMYKVAPVENGILVSFQKPVETAGVFASLKNSSDAGQNENQPRDTPTARDALMVQSVETSSDPSGTDIFVRAGAPITRYRSFTVNAPPRIVYDMPGLRSAGAGEKTIPVNAPEIKRIRYSSSTDKFRLVVDTDSVNMRSYSEQPAEYGLKIRVGDDKPATHRAPAPPVVLSPKTEKSRPETIAIVTAEALNVRKNPDTDSRPLAVVSQGARLKVLADEGEWLRIAHNDVTGYVRNRDRYIQMVSPVQNADRPAWVNRIDFTSDPSGESTITIGTTYPVKYDLEKADPQLIRLKLLDTNIPEARMRPLITTRFPGAVDRVLPVQTASMDHFSLVAIELRESVPYRTETNENLIRIHFDASTIPPKPFVESDLPPIRQILSQLLAEDTQPETVGSDGEQARQQGRRFTGEKISLDFFNTDIKNVFRIVKEVSGKNFAVDSDVQGKVTLSLEKPVPWDQILDLILRMNQLGKIEEGNVIRIARLETIEKELAQKRAAAAAKQAADEKKKALDPLKTEYILVNYSNAKKDILPHVEKILTKERGSISVDERTNQIIITDTAKKIAQARELVQQLDKVTPQVIIEARIVEATSDFTRSLGVNWGAASGYQTELDPNVFGTQPDAVTSAFNTLNSNGKGLGGTLAVNPPAITPYGALGFTFANIAGTALLLNAQLTASELENDVKIISSPRIVTLDNTEAVIKQGRRVPYNKQDEAGNTVTEFIDIELTLTVTPHVTPDNRIGMTIGISKNDQAGTLGNVPVVATNEAQTELLVNDGDTVVIGGIVKSDERDFNDKIPGLGKIPVLGWLFKTNTRQNNKNELLIFITPRIVQLEQLNRPADQS